MILGRRGEIGHVKYCGFDLALALALAFALDWARSYGLEYPRNAQASVARY